MNKLMSSSMFGLAPIAPSQTLVSNDEERPGVENDEISPPVIERMATREEIVSIREELDARVAGGTTCGRRRAPSIQRSRRSVEGSGLPTAGPWSSGQHLS